MSIVNRPANTLDPALAADAWAAVSTWAKLPAVNAAIDAEHLSFSRHSVCYSGRLRRQPVPLERAFVVSRLPPGRPTLTPALIKLIAMSDAEAQSYHIARPMAVQKAAHGEHNHRIQILSRHECDLEAYIERKHHTAVGLDRDPELHARLVKRHMKDWFLQLLKALQHLHAQHIVHKDIHGGQLLLRIGEDHANVELADFSDAQVVDPAPDWPKHPVGILDDVFQLGQVSNLLDQVMKRDAKMHWQTPWAFSVLQQAVHLDHAHYEPLYEWRGWQALRGLPESLGKQAHRMMDAQAKPATTVLRWLEMDEMWRPITRQDT